MNGYRVVLGALVGVLGAMTAASGAGRRHWLRCHWLCAGQPMHLGDGQRQPVDFRGPSSPSAAASLPTSSCRGGRSQRAMPDRGSGRS